MVDLEEECMMVKLRELDGADPESASRQCQPVLEMSRVRMQPQS